MSLLLAGAALLAAPAAATASDTSLRLDSRQSLRQQFDYAPDYEVNLPSFDAHNRACIRSRTASQHVTKDVFSLRRGAFHSTSILDAVRRAYPGFRATVNAGGWGSDAVEADALGRLYTLLEIRVGDGSLRTVLLYSTDAGRSWRLVSLPFKPPRTSPDGLISGTSASEHLVGWNLRSEPPLLAFWRPVSDWPGERACRMALYVIQPRFEGDQLVLPAPVLVSDRSLGVIQAAGDASFAATVGSTTYIVWAEVAPPDAPGAPTFVAAYDQTTGTLSAPLQVATARPPNDDHTTPGIVADGQGILHVLTGSHNTRFMYTHTIDPADATLWTDPVPVLSSGYVKPGLSQEGRGCQTYLSLVCTPDNALVIAFRQRRRGVDAVFGGRSYDALSVQCLEPGGTWSDARRVVYCSNNAGYAQYYHKLTIDRRGRLYLSLSYFRPCDWPANKRAANRYHHRMLLISEDGGTSWRFARLADFVNGAVAPASTDAVAAAAAPATDPAAPAPASAAATGTVTPPADAEQ
ncbi:MAG: BNR-4 repeat-containing protein [Actinobacteria bacterium]|nr:BNR-4 repeat-containing protein [Actinomycetota bacterium]